MILEVITQGLLSLNQAVILSFPYFFPAALFLLAWRLWRYYIIRSFISKIEWVTLEVKLPKEHQKTPLAMEVVLNAFYKYPTPPSWWDYCWVGKVPGWHSLEMVSIDGHVHFIIRTPKDNKGNVENHIYSQYPNAEVHQVPDYVGGVDYMYSDGKWSLFGAEQILVREDAYPIKTYIDYGLERELLKEEQKVDPLTPTIEFLGSIGEGEQVWLQILVMAAQARFKKPGTLFGKEDWKGNAKVVLDKLLKKDVVGFSPMQLSPGERTTVEAIEKSLTKTGFDCGIRVLYLAKKEKFNKANSGALMGGIFRQYGSLHINSFKPNRFTLSDWWNDPFGWRLARRKRILFKSYVNRGYFYSPYKCGPFTLNAEELATIYHFPGAVSVTPTFGRLESKRSEAPVNLPI